MLTLPPGVRVFVATDRVDGRKGMDGLSVLVRSRFGEDPLSGTMFVFFSRRADRVRVLYWDRDGYVLLTKRRLFLALCRRYGLKPFREPGRRQTTVQLSAPKAFHERTLWPQYKALSEELDAHLNELTTRVIREAIDDDVSEATEQPATKALPPAIGD